MNKLKPTFNAKPYNETKVVEKIDVFDFKTSLSSFIISELLTIKKLRIVSLYYYILKNHIMTYNRTKISQKQ